MNIPKNIKLNKLKNNINILLNWHEARKNNFLQLKGRQGITLIELVIVITLISSMIAFLSSSIPAILKSAANDNAEKIQINIDYAYNFALIKNTTTILEVDFDNNKVTVYALEEGEEGQKKKKLKQTKFDPSGKIVKMYDIRGIEYKTGKVEVPFNYEGISENFIFCLGTDSEIKLSVLNFKYNRQLEVKRGEIDSFENK